MNAASFTASSVSLPVSLCVDSFRLLVAIGIPAPRPFCYLETPRLLWISVITDTLIAASYFLIFVSLIWIAATLRDIAKFSRYLWILVSFGLFIVACGGTHLTDVLSLWWPEFGVAAAIRIFCAAASVPTAIFFAKATPSIARNTRSFVEVLASTQEQRDAAQGALTAADAIAAERLQAANQIAAANEQLQSVMNSTSECILQISTDWNVLYGNRQAVSSLPDLQFGGDIWTSFPALRSTEAEKELKSAMVERSERKFETYYEPDDRWYRVSVYPTGIGVSIFCRDITSQRKLEESLTRERLLKEEHIQAMSHLAGGLAHEISNPLAIIHARASDLQESAASDAPPTPATVEAASASIVRTADRAIRILRGLKVLSRSSNDDPKQLCDVRSICRESIELQASRFERHKIEMRLDFSLDIPLVLCRDFQIGQIISNLLSNAFDAIVQSQSTERWISIEIGARDANVCVRVADSGPGISQIDRIRIMQPFFTTKKAGFGTGVGLSLSHAIANEHDGSLTLCEGTANTTFELLLPISGRSDVAPPIGGEVQ